MSALEAQFAGFEKYEHERWHKLNNDMQPLVRLPEQLARDIAKIQGGFDGRIAVVTKEIERSITSAVEKAIEPLSAEVADLKSRVGHLEASSQQVATERGMIAAIFKSPAIGWLVGLIISAWAILGGKVQP